MAAYTINTNADHESALRWMKANISQYKNDTHQQIIVKRLVKDFAKIISDIYDREIIQPEVRTDDAKSFDVKIQELKDAGILT